MVLPLKRRKSRSLPGPQNPPLFLIYFSAFEILTAGDAVEIAGGQAKAHRQSPPLSRALF
jgi:hypothetical protein